MTTGTAAAAPGRLRRGALSITALAATAAFLADGLAGVAGAQRAAAVSFVVYILLALPGARPTPYVLATVSLGCLGWGWLNDAPVAAWAVTAGERGALIIALFSAMALLGAVAGYSRLIGRCGQVLIAQPAGRRYAALTSGAHVIGLLLNIGAVHLLGRLVARATQDGAAGPASARIRRRMVTALQRGFAATVMWSPLSVCFAVVLTVLDGAHVPTFLAAGLAATAATLAWGWGLDRLQARRQARLGPPRTPTGGWHVFLPLFGLVGGVFALALSLAALADARIIVGVIAGAPVLAAAWLGVQAWRGSYDDPGSPTGRRYACARMASYLTGDLPDQRREAVVIANMAAMAALLVLAVPGDWLAGPMAALPRPVAVAAALWGTVALSLVGLNPIVSTTLLGTALAATAPPGAPLVPGALALAWGWGLCLTASPFTACVLLTARYGEAGPWRVGLGWNGLYWLGAAVGLSSVAGLLELVLS